MNESFIMTYKEILLKCTVLVLICKQGQSCSPWVKYGDSCYQIFQHKVNKCVAEFACADNGSVLASLSNDGERNFVVNLIDEAKRNATVGSYWVGLHNINGQLLWNNREAAKKLPWLDAPSGNTSSDCFVFNRTKVVPLHCSEKAGFICEKLRQQESSVSSCPKRACTDDSSNKCFWFTHMQLTKIGSDVVCSLQHGHLAGKEGLYQSHEVFSRCKETIPRLQWTSLIFRNQSLLSEDQTKLIHHHSQEVLSGDEECAAAVAYNETMYFLERKPCSDEAIGLCESNFYLAAAATSGSVTEDSTSPDPFWNSCPSGGGWLRGITFCFWESSHRGAKLSWNDARKYCQSYAGDLVSIHNSGEESFLFSEHNQHHSYWVGLQYNLDENKYKWSDKTAVDYQDWAEGQTDDIKTRERCVYIDKLKGQWRHAYCGRLMRFICKAPMVRHPPLHVDPTPEPLIECGKELGESYFEHYCYYLALDPKNWHEAQRYCEEKGSNLVSVTSEAEQDFLIRVTARFETLSKRMWIGLNSLDPRGSFRWIDGVPYGFINWAEHEPNNQQNQEKCVSMSMDDAMWADTNCNKKFIFVCKRRNGTVILPWWKPTTPPVKGYCTPGWEMFEDRCFRIIGKDKSDWKNYHGATEVCHQLGGYLATVRNYKDQAFLFYMIQKIKMEAYIGLHDLDSPGDYYWPDNSPLDYVNWAGGEPPEKLKQKNCVIISYDVMEEGRWKGIDCDNVLPYICQIPPDPSLTKPIHLLGTGCPRAPSFIKQGSCYRVFSEMKSWQEAETTCNRYNGHLVSIYDLEAYAVVNYLAAMDLEKEETFWIGLKSTNQRSIRWINKWPLSFSRWGTNEPRHNHHTDVCFFTSFSGHWESGSCSKARKFICQITIGEPVILPEPKKGGCPLNSSLSWEDIGYSCTLYVGDRRRTWYEANSYCTKIGAHLVSFHSMEDIEQLSITLKEERELVHIGLRRETGGGFMWADRSPVDFINWAPDEPSDRDEEIRDEDENCVEIITFTMEWRVISCQSERNFLCSKLKDGERTTENVVTPSVAIGLSTILVLPIGGIAIIILYFRPCRKGWERFSFSSCEEGTGDHRFEDDIVVGFQDGKVTCRRKGLF